MDRTPKLWTELQNYGQNSKTMDRTPGFSLSKFSKIDIESMDRDSKVWTEISLHPV